MGWYVCMRGGGERLLCVKMKQWRESLTDCTCGSRVLEEQIFGPLAVEHLVLLSTKTVLIWQFSFFFSQKKVFESRKINHMCLGVSILMEACSTKKKMYRRGKFCNEESTKDTNKEEAKRVGEDRVYEFSLESPDCSFVFARFLFLFVQFVLLRRTWSL